MGQGQLKLQHPIGPDTRQARVQKGGRHGVDDIVLILSPLLLMQVASCIPGWSLCRLKRHVHHRSRAEPPAVCQQLLNCTGKLNTTRATIPKRRMDGPIYDCYGFAVRTIAITKERVIDSNVFETLDNCERRAWKNRFDCSGRRLLLAIVGGLGYMRD